MFSHPFFLGRLGKADPIQSMYSPTVIGPSLRSSRLVIAWYMGEAPRQEAVNETVLNTEDVCQEIVDLTNDLRREHGLPIFATDNKLMETAQVRAEEMVATTTACHTRARMAGGIVPPQTVRTQQRIFTVLQPGI